MTAEECMFFQNYPGMLPLYGALLEALRRAHPDVAVKVSKTQISLKNRYIFACASLPWRKVKGWPKDYLRISFGLPCQAVSPRIVNAVEAYPNRWTHHVLLTAPGDIDAQLLGWLEEAYAFAMVK